MILDGPSLSLLCYELNPEGVFPRRHSPQVIAQWIRLEFWSRFESTEANVEWDVVKIWTTEDVFDKSRRWEMLVNRGLFVEYMYMRNPRSLWLFAIASTARCQRRFVDEFTRLVNELGTS